MYTCTCAHAHARARATYTARAGAREGQHCRGGVSSHHGHVRLANLQTNKQHNNKYENTTAGRRPPAAVHTYVRV